MLSSMAIEVIPAIDIIDGKCVRLKHGDYAQKVEYQHDPVELTKRIEAAGIKRLHLVDLDGAKASKLINLRVLEGIASNTQLVIDFGGGVRDFDSAEAVFNAGASMINIGSTAVKDPELALNIFEHFGAEKIILEAGVTNNHIAINGWTEVSDISLDKYLEKYTAAGINKVLCTETSRDGSLSGVSVEFYSDIKNKYPGVYLIASGGVAGMTDLVALNQAGIDAVVVGKAFLDGRISLGEIASYA